MPRVKLIQFVSGLLLGSAFFFLLLPKVLSVFGHEWNPSSLFGYGRHDGPAVVETVAETNVRTILQLNANYVEDIVVIPTDSTIPRFGPDRRLVVWSYWDIGARIGFDLEEAEVTITDRGRMIFINLPEPTVTDSVLYSHWFYEYERSGFDESEVSSLLDRHRQQAFCSFLGRVRAGQIEGVFEQAKVRAEDMILAFIEGMGFERANISIAFGGTQNAEIE